MTRYSAGVYTLLNRADGGAGVAIEYFLDNQRYTLPSNTMITVQSFNWIGFTATSTASIFKVGQTNDQVIGNSSLYDA